MEAGGHVGVSESLIIRVPSTDYAPVFGNPPYRSPLEASMCSLFVKLRKSRSGFEGSAQ